MKHTNKIIVLDEPSTELHPSDSQKLLDFIDVLVDQGNTLIAAGFRRESAYFTQSSTVTHENTPRFPGAATSTSKLSLPSLMFTEGTVVPGGRKIIVSPIKKFAVKKVVEQRRE